MSTKLKFLRTILLAGMFCLAVSAEGADPTFSLSGFTFRWDGTDIYSALPTVKVVVSRYGNLVAAGASADEKGEAVYQIAGIRAGEPIQVTFFLSKDFVPEMQSLSAKAGVDHRISAALMTIKQFKELQKNNPFMPKLKDKLACIAEIVPKESPIYKEIESMLMEARKEDPDGPMKHGGERVQPFENILRQGESNPLIKPKLVPANPLQIPQ